MGSVARQLVAAAATAVRRDASPAFPMFWRRSKSRCLARHSHGRGIGPNPQTFLTRGFQ